MVENVRVSTEIALPSVTVQQLFPLPVSWSTYEFLMSADVGQCRQCHILVGRGRKCGGSRLNRIDISFRSKVISTCGFVADIVVSRCRPMSDNVGSVIFQSGLVENVASAHRIASMSP